MKLDRYDDDDEDEDDDGDDDDDIANEAWPLITHILTWGLGWSSLRAEAPPNFPTLQLH